MRRVAVMNHAPDVADQRVIIASELGQAGNQAGLVFMAQPDGTRDAAGVNKGL